MIDKSWTLFLDRDGTINQKAQEHDYIKSWDEFFFLPHALEALKILSKKFGHIVIVSNQQGVGKSVMSMDDLNAITARMLEEIKKGGGRVDMVIYATNLEGEEFSIRKPETDMAFEAQDAFPEIDFSKSVVVGDSLTDMEFGRRIGAQTFLIGKGKTLYDFAKRI